MTKVVKTNEALLDLARIWFDTDERWGEDRADRYSEALTGQLERLAEYLHLGRAVDHIRRGVRRLLFRRHVAFYWILQNGDVEIIRVLHDRMDDEVAFGEIGDD